jgi:hydroxymethylglutaryl-CoA lyase
MVEVGPRDGLQNEIKQVPSEKKIQFINLLSQTGLSAIEVTSFVSPKKIPQLVDNKKVLETIEKKPNIHYLVLVPNVIGFKNALAAGTKEIAVFTAVSETFSQKNSHCSIVESLERISAITTQAKQHRIPVRGYISCVLGCPYEGNIPFVKTANLAKELIQLGCYEISLGDTIGIGTPGTTRALLDTVLEKIPVEKIAVHFHDTYGQALANIYVALERGISIIDSSVSGLGGCPYAKGATGNVASEDVLYLLNGLDIETGVDLSKLINAGNFISDFLQRPMGSKVAVALLAKNKS